MPIEPAAPGTNFQGNEQVQHKAALPGQMQVPKAYQQTYHRRKISLVTDSSHTASSPKPSPRQKTIVPRLHLDEMQTLQKKKLATTPAARMQQGRTPRSRGDKESAKRMSARRHEPYKNLQYSQLTDRTASNGGQTPRSKEGENAPAPKRRSFMTLGLAKGASKAEAADVVCKEERLENEFYERKIGEAQRRKQQLLEELERLKFEV